MGGGAGARSEVQGVKLRVDFPMVTRHGAQRRDAVGRARCVAERGMVMDRYAA